jgi:hypothetical protein
MTDDRERQLRIMLMTTQIEIGAAALLAAGVAIGRFWLFHT